MDIYGGAPCNLIIAIIIARDSQFQHDVIVCVKTRMSRNGYSEQHATQRCSKKTQAGSVPRFVTRRSCFFGLLCVAAVLRLRNLQQT